MDDKPLEETLDEMRDEGELEGEGVFTVNAARARSSMQKFLLENPRSYVLNLVAYAVASSASEIQIYKDMDDLLLTHDGDPLTEDEMRSLARPTDEGPIPLRELGFALRGAQSLKPKWVTVESGSNRLRMTADDCTLEARESEESCTRVHVKEPLTLRNFFRARGEEEYAVRTRCCFAPGKVILNGRSVKRSWLPPDGLLGELATDQTEISDAMVEQAFELPVLEGEFQSCRGLVYFARRKEAVTNSLRVILNGVAFDQAEDLGWEGARAVLFCSHLKKDLSQSSLVRDQAYLELVKFVRQRLAFLAGLLVDHWESISPYTRNQRMDLLSRAVDELLEEQDFERAVSGLRSLVNHFSRYSGPEDPETQRQRLRLAEALVSAGVPEEAVEVFVEQAQLAGAAGHWRRQRQLLSRTLEIRDGGFDLPHAELVHVVRALALSQARLGLEQECLIAVARLESLLKNEPGGAEAFRQFELELEVTGQQKAGPLLQCAQCGGERLMTDCPLLGKEGREIEVRVGPPESLFFKSELDAPLKATVCGDCGHVSFRVENPEALWTKRQQH
jgi:hypothetical protein